MTNEKTWCVTPNCLQETGKYGNRPALYCDECRWKNIMNLGRAGDEPDKTFTEVTGINQLVTRKGGVFAVTDDKLDIKQTEADKAGFEKLKSFFSRKAKG